LLQNRVVERFSRDERAAVKRAADIAQGRGKNARSKMTNKPRRFLVSGRTALGRCIQDIADQYAFALGGWQARSDLTAANVRRTAELMALAEKKRGIALRDGNIDLFRLVRLEGAARRAEAALQLDVKREPEPETLQEYMDAVDTERAAEAARNRRPGSRTTPDSSLAERFKPRCAVGQPTSRKTSPAQPTGTPARFLPTEQTASYEARRPRMSRGMSKDEGADSYAAIVARLNENWRIIVCAAGIQWILQCRGEKYGAVRWRHRSFCRTSEALRRVVRQRAGKIDPAAAAILAGLPAWIEEFVPERTEDDQTAEAAL
jgi:hypothetical protein